MSTAASKPSVYPLWVPPKGWVPYRNPNLTDEDIAAVWEECARAKRRLQAAERGEDWRRVR